MYKSYKDWLFIVGLVVFVVGTAFLYGSQHCHAATPVPKNGSLVHPCYAKGEDCLTWMLEHNPKGYCDWAGAMAGAGAYYRINDKLPRADIDGRVVNQSMPRDLNDHERLVTVGWLRWGWDHAENMTVLQVRDTGMSYCQHGDKTL